MLCRKIICVCFEIHTVWAERRRFEYCSSGGDECWVCAEQTASGEDSNYLQTFYCVFCTRHVVGPFFPFTSFTVYRNQTGSCLYVCIYVCNYVPCIWYVVLISTNSTKHIFYFNNINSVTISIYSVLLVGIRTMWQLFTVYNLTHKLPSCAHTKHPSGKSHDPQQKLTHFSFPASANELEGNTISTVRFKTKIHSLTIQNGS